MPANGQMQQEAHVNGTGALTVDDIRALVNGLPGNATITITQQDGGERDGQSWRFVAKWVTQPRTNGQLHPFGASLRQLDDERQSKLRQGQFGDH